MHQRHAGDCNPLHSKLGPYTRWAEKARSRNMKTIRLGLNLLAGCGTLILATAAAPSAHSQGTPPQCEKGEMCICTGSPAGNYQKAGEAIVKQLGSGLGSRSRDTRVDSMAQISGLQKADSGRV